MIIVWKNRPKPPMTCLYYLFFVNSNLFETYKTFLSSFIYYFNQSQFSLCRMIYYNRNMIDFLLNRIICRDHFKDWEQKRSKCFFTYIHLYLFCSHPSIYLFYWGLVWLPIIPLVHVIWFSSEAWKYVPNFL